MNVLPVIAAATEGLAGLVRTAPVEQLPEIIGELARAQAIAQQRLAAPAPVEVATTRLLTPAEAATALKVSRWQVGEMARRREIDAVRLGKRLIRFEQAAIDRAIAARRKKGTHR